MAIENELKYILSPSEELYEVLNGLDGHRETICQGYLNNETRIRRFTSGETVTYMFSFKKRLANGRNFEVEQELSEEDFLRLWDECSVTLTKDRIKIHDGDVHWDIDTYLDGDYPYFMLAEVEMPEKMDVPKSIPSFLQEHILHQVERDDGRFTARELAEPKYASLMLSLLKKWSGIQKGWNGFSPFPVSSGRLAICEI